MEVSVDLTVGRTDGGTSRHTPKQTAPSQQTNPQNRRAALAAERARAEAVGERLRRLQGFQLEDDGVAALHLLVLEQEEQEEEGGAGAGAPPPSFRVAHATNAAHAAAFAGRGEGVAEAECVRRVVDPLLFAA